MNCRDYQDLIILLNCGEISDNDRDILKAHIGECSSCAKFEGEVASSLSLLKASRRPSGNVDLLPLVREKLRAPAVQIMPRWALVPALSLIALAVFFTKPVFKVQPQAGYTDMEIVNDLEFVSDYGVIEELAEIESLDKV